jgi:D-arabinose 1-dehydrogenase-like Zn-dependent alcohol dehydrogenase
MVLRLQVGVKLFLYPERHIKVGDSHYLAYRTSDMAPLIQKALLLDGKLGKFSLGAAPVPNPGPGEILVKIKTASLNPVDWMIQKLDGFLPIETFPAILGADISGDVEEIGEGVTEFQKSDRV